MSTYSLINICVITLPLILSFDKRVAFFKSWKYIIPSIAITAMLFIIWDSVFTFLGVWRFNPIHVGSAHLLGLPLDEVMFFIIVPYASLFIYDVLKEYVKKDLPERITRYFATTLIVFLIIIATVYHARLYTFICFILLAVTLIIIEYVIKPDYMGRFFMAYGVILIPFIIVNGLLTGTCLDAPVVLYNDSENMGIKLLTIPVEDIFYGMLLILLNVSVYEKLKNIKAKGNI
ncbi:MAG: lycopene cyclase domain-containing protein [Bacteroidales bacterium]|nr:lycopene cyclase domain-containing protein [Bacteroidales bacterium]